MLSAQDAIRLASEVSPEKKVESLLGKKTQVAIDNAVMQAINKAKQKVEIVLDDRVCYEADKDIRKALELL
jgi:rRNA-processing protein FCF1